MGDIQLTNEEIENCRVAFNKFDKDGSGSISDYELKTMLQCAPPRAPPVVPFRLAGREC